MKHTLLLLAISFLYWPVHAQENSNSNKFRQLHSELPDPNVYRTASGAPGVQYWQQQADYKIEIRLDENHHRIYGEETITYHNNSPDVLSYLWVQLDQNMRSRDSDSHKIRTQTLGDSISIRNAEDLIPWFDGGFNLEYVRDAQGADLPYTVNKTMMRIDLPKPLKPQASVSFGIKWNYLVNDRMRVGGRSGYEMFANENNAIYTIAQFYPRMAVYSDVEGWQHKQFLGMGEFTLPFGNYDVKITVPADHVLAATGELQNAKAVLNAEQQRRLDQARASRVPVEVVTQAEVEQNEKGRSDKQKTWHFKAVNVRDFAFATSRKFIWDAMGVPFGNRTVMAMSYYPKEANPLWGQYSTEVVAHTLRSYSKYTFDYPYPVAISVNAAEIGMEYPMICFNYGRCEPDGTYSKRMKYGVISVIIHEVGHNYFPMIVNSDERQWTWMDEGLNSFLQFLAEQEFEREYPSRSGEPRKIVDYMKGDKSRLEPIMTDSESIIQFGSNAYTKPAIALNILRETIMGRELFDHAFKTYATRWMFRHPSPADFFRTMEDASAVDLDWFWRGWFFTTDYVDLAIDHVKWMHTGEETGAEMEMTGPAYNWSTSHGITEMRNRTEIANTLVEQKPSLRDFYTPKAYSPLPPAPVPVRYSAMSPLVVTNEGTKPYKHFYEVGFSNRGEMPMPIILELMLADSSTQLHYIPAEIWKKGESSVTKVFATELPVIRMVLDPYQQTADVDLSNNIWPSAGAIPSRLQLFKSRRQGRFPAGINEMQRARSTSE